MNRHDNEYASEDDAKPPSGDDLPSAPWTCPTCGGHDTPARWVKAQVEWAGLTDHEREAARVLLRTLHAQGQPTESSWEDALWECLRALVPMTAEAIDDTKDAADFLPIFRERPISRGRES